MEEEEDEEAGAPGPPAVAVAFSGVLRDAEVAVGEEWSLFPILVEEEEAAAVGEDKGPEGEDMGDFLALLRNME